MNMVLLEKPRKRVNLMLDSQLLDALDEFVPAGDRSNFVNDALYEALKQISRKHALEGLKQLRAQNKVKLSTKEILELINHGRD